MKSSRGGNDYGLVKLSSSQSITNSVGLALPASENNAGISGTLANRIANNRNALAKKQQFYPSLESLGITSTFIPEIALSLPTNSSFRAQVNGTGIYDNSKNKIPFHAGILSIERAEGYSRILFTHTTSGGTEGSLFIGSVNLVTKTVNGWYKLSGEYIE